jgi:uncharacterized protein (UPF0147 family)
VVQRAAEDLKLELLRLRPALTPLDRAKQRLRHVLEALDQRTTNDQRAPRDTQRTANDSRAATTANLAALVVPAAAEAVAATTAAAAAAASTFSAAAAGGAAVAVATAAPPSPAAVPRANAVSPPSPAVLEALKVRDHRVRAEERDNGLLE